MSEPTVSVLTTVYNRSRFLSITIESILDQTYSDFELIIVDDTSTDSSFRVANQYHDHPRVRIYQNEANLGQFRNRNRAARFARGKYLKYVDSDDAIYPHCLAVMVQSMERFPNAGVGICKQPRKDVMFPIELSPKQAYRESFLGDGLLSNAPNSTIYRRDVFEDFGGFRDNVLMEDVLLLNRIVASFPVVLITSGLDWYRDHNNQISKSIGDHDWRMTEPVRNFPEILRSTKCPLTVQEQQQAYDNLIANFVRYCLRLALKGNLSFAFRSWKASGLHWLSVRYACFRSCRPYRYPSSKCKLVEA